MQWQKSSLDDFVHIVFVLVLSAKVVQASAMKVYLLIAKCSLSFRKDNNISHTCATCKFKNLHKRLRQICRIYTKNARWCIVLCTHMRLFFA